MATIYDIAQACGTSVATVSYVLNGQGSQRKISPATQEKVFAAARDLGYRRRSRPTRSAQISIAVYWLQRQLEMTMPGLIAGINSCLSTETTPIDLLIRPYEQGLLSRQESLWVANSYDAAILVGPDAADLHYVEQNPPAIPLVLINRELPQCSSVSIDPNETGRLAAQHAILKGGDDLALVLNPASLYGLNTRAEVIIHCCEEQGVSLKNRMFYCLNDIESGYELGRDLVRNNRLHKVFICIYDMAALGLMSALNEAGVAVGEEVQIIATSSSSPPLFARSSPPMTVVDLKLEETSEKALKMAIDLAARRISGPQKVVIPPTIIYRRSCPLNSFSAP